ncbi:MAG TPA: hypothetical protein VGW38_04920 [Chloroflexota bacterium]|nr:hypothetical protein [Chloroflexota bacterium]
MAARLGIELRRPAQIRLDTIAQRWTRDAVKRWPRFRLGSGKAFGSVTVDVRAMV